MLKQGIWVALLTLTVAAAPVAWASEAGAETETGAETASGGTETGKKRAQT